MNVLLVDDDRDALELRRMILEARGHRVNAAHSAARAREQFLAERPEAVVLDVRVPHAEDGLELIREFRAASPCLRLIVLSGWPADLDGREERGLVDRILEKPARSETLLNALQ